MHLQARRARVHSRMRRAHDGRIAAALSTQWPAHFGLTRNDLLALSAFVASGALMAAFWLAPRDEHESLQSAAPSEVQREAAEMARALASATSSADDANHEAAGTVRARLAQNENGSVNPACNASSSDAQWSREECKDAAVQSSGTHLSRHAPCTRSLDGMPQASLQPAVCLQAEAKRASAMHAVSKQCLQLHLKHRWLISQLPHIRAAMQAM